MYIFIKNKKKKLTQFLPAIKFFSWFWFKNKPVNYKPNVLPRSQDAKPIIMETTGLLYGIRKKTLKKYKCRIGKKTLFFLRFQKKESLDLDTKEDFKNS